MIKIFDTKASYDAASKSQAESDISLVKANNTAYVNGTNVCISQPKVGDIKIQKDDSSISYISQRSHGRRWMISTNTLR